MNKLLPCPFYEKSETLTINKANNAFSKPNDCNDPMPYMHTESYAVTCDASKPDGPGGCGASGGYKLTEDEAIAAWNRRAALAQHQAKALDGVEPFWHAVISQRAPVVDKAVRRRDVADEYAEKCGEYYPGVEVVPLVPASTLAAAQARIAELEALLQEAGRTIDNLTVFAGRSGQSIQVRAAIDAARKESK